MSDGVLMVYDADDFALALKETDDAILVSRQSTAQDAHCLRREVIRVATEVLICGKRGPIDVTSPLRLEREGSGTGVSAS
jgi:hypothetical protein